MRSSLTIEQFSCKEDNFSHDPVVQVRLMAKMCHCRSATALCRKAECEIVFYFKTLRYFYELSRKLKRGFFSFFSRFSNRYVIIDSY